MSRRFVILCALVGCAPATPGSAAPAEPSVSSSAVARADASPSDDEREPTGPASAAPPSEVPPANATAASEPPPDEGGSVATDSADDAPPGAEANADPDVAPIADAAAGPVVIAVDEVPKFARLDLSPRKLGKLRATIRRVGTLYAPSSLMPLTDDGSGDGLLGEVRVIDGDAAGDPRRPRVLCENEASRLGVAVDADDLATTVRTNAFVGPRITPPERVTSKTPGVRLAGGTEIDVRGEAYEGATPITYRGLFLVAEGYVPSKLVDVVYAPGELADDGRRNGELLENVRFLDAPDGLEVARTERSAALANTMHVLRLGPVEDGHVLVRYQELDAFVVGWIPSESVRTYATEKHLDGWGRLTGRGAEPKVAVELARGTRLVPTTSNEVIGVVTKTYSAPCVAECEGPNPHVSVWACSRPLTVRAVP